MGRREWKLLRWKGLKGWCKREIRSVEGSGNPVELLKEYESAKRVVSK